MGFCVVRFDLDGQCETPEAWDEQLVQRPTLFYIMYRTIICLLTSMFGLLLGCILRYNMGEIKKVVIDDKLYTQGEGIVSVNHDGQCSSEEILKTASSYVDKISGESLDHPSVRLKPDTLNTKDIITESGEKLKRTDIECELYTKNN